MKFSGIVSWFFLFISFIALLICTNLYLFHRGNPLYEEFYACIAVAGENPISKEALEAADEANDTALKINIPLPYPKLREKKQ